MTRITLFVPLLFMAIGCGKPEATPVPAPETESAKPAPVQNPSAAVKFEIRYYAFAG